MFSKSSRLSSERFDEILKGGLRISSDFFTCWYQKTALPSRFSAVAPSKTYKKATERVRVRRRVYGALRRALQSLPDFRNIDAVFIARQAAGNATPIELSMDITHVLGRIGRS